MSESGVRHKHKATKVCEQCIKVHTELDMINILMESFLALYKLQVISESNIGATNGLILEDPGLRDNFIIHAFAEDLKLPSEPITTSIKVCQSRRYQFQMEDMTGRKHTFNAIGVENIADNERSCLLSGSQE